MQKIISKGNISNKTVIIYLSTPIYIYTNYYTLDVNIAVSAL